MIIKHTQGFTLLEVLIALSLFSILLLSLEASQLFSLQQQLNYHHRHLALRQLRNMRERLQLLQGQEGYQEQESIWNQENQDLLPRARGEVSGSYPQYSIKLCWGGSAKEQREMNTKCLSENFNLNC